MAASGAPLHSFYLNYVSLDRYRKLDNNFVFNPGTKLLHYDGARLPANFRNLRNRSRRKNALIR
jgi:hypothetical protein